MQAGEAGVFKGDLVCGWGSGGRVLQVLALAGGWKAVYLCGLLTEASRLVRFPDVCNQGSWAVERGCQHLPRLGQGAAIL